MARIGPLIQDQDLNIHFNGVPVGGKTNLSKAPKKGLSGRKPLGDLSNSVKATPHQAVSKSNLFSLAEKEIGSSGIIIPTDASKKKTVPKSTGRKALSDISNSSKHCPSEASKKKNQTAKLTAVAEEQIPHCAFSDESFLHNHQQCVKNQSKNIDMAEFLQIVGLDNDIAKQTAAARALPMSNQKSKSHPSFFELDDIAELLIEETDSPTKEHRQFEFSMLDSPYPNKTPKPMNHHKEWNGLECSFKLLETPELRKY